MGISGRQSCYDVMAQSACCHGPISYNEFRVVIACSLPRASAIRESMCVCHLESVSTYSY